MNKRLYLTLLLVACIGICTAQKDRFTIQNKKGETKVRFQLINNLIVFPAEVNGIELSFLLDTGITKPMIFNIVNMSDSLMVKNPETTILRGLGEGESVEALKSDGNVIKIGDALKLDQDLYAIYDSRLNFAPKLGAPINGIIGYDILKDFVVEINYSSKFLKFYNAESYEYKTCNSCEVLGLGFYNNKPFIHANVTVNKKAIPVKMLIDSGGSDAIWLFENDSLGIKCGSNYFRDFLGYGLSGSVYGKRSKIDGFSLNSFIMKEVNVSYPDSTSISYDRIMEGRNGTVAGEILKRFNIILDYKQQRITFRKNGYFRNKFFYNKSGIVLEYGGYRYVREKDNNDHSVTIGNNSRASSAKVVLNTKYRLNLKPAYTIVELREGSPGALAGLKLGDIIIKINGKLAHSYTLQEITQMFHDDNGKFIRLLVERKGKKYEHSFKLKDILN
ncbi:PDZ domain-containing protein [Hyunsoonleella rubra]|uniref:PDZ domain-containing protein n=1 Tax=Hyunsoonleella rubra TaxID=1737062 RepID=A0ABW5T8B2_9FLAO